MFDRFDRSGRPHSPRRSRRFRRFRRSRVPWLLSAAGALLAGGITASVVQRADQTLAAYGTRQLVAVATTDLAVGDVIGDGDVVWEHRPAVLVNGMPVDHPVGATVLHPIVEGELLIGDRVAPDGLSPTQALIGPGRRALVLDVTDGPGTLTVGVPVDLLSAGSLGGGRPSWVARNATVVALGDTTVTVAVDEADAPDTARAALDGTVVIALIGAP